MSVIDFTVSLINNLLITPLLHVTKIQYEVQVT